MRLDEITGDKGFDSMMGNITNPIDNPKDAYGDKFFQVGDILLKQLESVIMTWPPEHIQEISDAYDNNPEQKVNGLQKFLNCHLK